MMQTRVERFLAKRGYVPKSEIEAALLAAAREKALRKDMERQLALTVEAAGARVDEMRVRSHEYA